MLRGHSPLPHSSSRMSEVKWVNDECGMTKVTNRVTTHRMIQTWCLDLLLVPSSHRENMLPHMGSVVIMALVEALMVGVAGDLTFAVHGMAYSQDNMPKITTGALVFFHCSPVGLDLKKKWTQSNPAIHIFYRDPLRSNFLTDQD